MAPPNKAENSIYTRNREATLEAEALLWRALCDGKPKLLRKYLAPDAVLTSPDTGKLYSPNSEPSLDEHIEDGFEPWAAYRMHDDPEFVEIDMMSSSLTYRVTAWREGEQGEMTPTEALCSSVWRQGAGGDWKCCVHHVTKV